MAGREKRSSKPSDTSKKTKAERLLEESTIFVDRGLGTELADVLIGKGFRVEKHDDNFDQDTSDPKWLLNIGLRGWVGLTKDVAMKRNPDEMQAIAQGCVRLFCIPKASYSSPEMQSMVLTNLRVMGRFLKDYKLAFIARIYSDRVELVFEQIEPGNPLIDRREFKKK